MDNSAGIRKSNDIDGMAIISLVLSTFGYIIYMVLCFIQLGDSILESSRSIRTFVIFVYYVIMFGLCVMLNNKISRYVYNDNGVLKSLAEYVATDGVKTSNSIWYNMGLINICILAGMYYIGDVTSVVIYVLYYVLVLPLSYLIKEVKEYYGNPGIYGLIERPSLPPSRFPTAITYPTTASSVPVTRGRINDEIPDEVLLDSVNQNIKFDSNLSKSDIESLPKINCSRIVDNNCCICMAEFANSDNFVSLSCSHCFHDKCISTWLKNKNECPECRTKAIVKK